MYAVGGRKASRVGRETRPTRKEQPYPIHLSAVMIVGFGRPVRNHGMIATGNHWDFKFAALCNTPYRKWGTRSVVCRGGQWPPETSRSPPQPIPSSGFAPSQSLPLMREVAARRADGRREKISASLQVQCPAGETGRETRPIRKGQPYPIHLSAVVIVLRLRSHRRGRVSRPYLISYISPFPVGACCRAQRI